MAGWQVTGRQTAGTWQVAGWLSADDSHRLRTQSRVRQAGSITGRQVRGKTADRRIVRVQASVSKDEAGRQREQAETWSKDKPGVGTGRVQARSRWIRLAREGQIQEWVADMQEMLVLIRQGLSASVLFK